MPFRQQLTVVLFSCIVHGINSYRKWVFLPHIVMSLKNKEAKEQICHKTLNYLKLYISFTICKFTRFTEPISKGGNQIYII